ncbi:uncharacterized protein STEHIDRAFT_162716 [Stereum hirsutum FP-91666 SS1]|uniref:Uncharacterized protein n=1 Tax=Stereum hirsutum (strain FP-91666) TaxID=721885 RepID=R7RY12_STEHR|nr:uncharacterized protein STEHIDRAFT_162716 [Stereum hirsutum FP-91666 SS1]EIM80296.1 hypothetical protein STEHIDRAFT_162716 [Stereum hirsutum FP-91666 SS1]
MALGTPIVLLQLTGLQIPTGPWYFDDNHPAMNHHLSSLLGFKWSVVDHITHDASNHRTLPYNSGVGTFNSVTPGGHQQGRPRQVGAIALPEQRRNTYWGYTTGQRSDMVPPMARSQSSSSSLIENQEDCGGFIHQEFVRALVYSEEAQHDSGSFLFGMASAGTDRDYDNPTMVNGYAQDHILQESLSQSQVDAQADADDFGNATDFRCRKSSGIFVSLEQLGYPPNKDFPEVVNGESGSISPSDPTGLNSPIPSRINDISGSIGNSGVAPNSFKEAGLVPAVSSTDESNGHTASSAGTMHGTNIPHGLPNDVPHARTRGSAKSSSPAAPAAPPALPTRSRRKGQTIDNRLQKGITKTVKKTGFIVPYTPPPKIKVAPPQPVLTS